MLKALRTLIGSKSDSRPQLPSVPAGQRYYAIGDIHGRLDLFNALIEAIEADDARSETAETHMILLGDLVDRGPDSAGVVRRAREWQHNRSVRILAGNHEDMFLESFEKPDILRHFLKHGGRETIISYGVSKQQFDAMTLEELFAALPRIVPEEERQYINAFEEKIVAGDYLFVHAGIDPTISISDQKRSDMLWIRDRFLNHQGPLEKVVVHGHTIFDDVVNLGNRVGIDTGAFRSGVLTALVLEGDKQRIIQSVDANGTIEITGTDALK